MYKFVAVFAILFLIQTTFGQADIKSFFMEQNLDHFDRQNRETWQMRYFTNDQFSEEEGPIFIWLNGHSGVGSPLWIEEGLFADIAEEVNATLYAVEMRYFGESRPTEDLSLDNLRFLTTEQTLSDLAHFVDFLKSNNTEAKVIIAGTGYGGNLAVWFRQKYPHLVDGIWSSSGGLRAKLDFEEYFQHAQSIVDKEGGGSCVGIIRRAFRILQNLVNGGRSESVSYLFSLCDSIDMEDPQEVTMFYQAIAMQTTYGILFGSDEDVAKMCYTLQTNTVTNDLLDFVMWFNEEHRNNGCFNETFASQVEQLSDISWDGVAATEGKRQVFFQTCSEYGEYATSNSRQSIFAQTIGIDYYVEWCSRVFGEIFTLERMQENIDHFNMKFGELNPMVSVAVYTNFDRNPLSTLNVRENSDSIEVFNLPGPISEFADLHSIDEADLPEITAAKQRIRELLIEWTESVEFL